MSEQQTSLLFLFIKCSSVYFFSKIVFLRTQFLPACSFSFAQILCVPLRWYLLTPLLCLFCYKPRMNNIRFFYSKSLIVSISKSLCSLYQSICFKEIKKLSYLSHYLDRIGVVTMQTQML